ncbi:MAG TPA: hypothetical protein PLS84_07100 [Salinivirgaceae bacterium]|jgi:hypothetical protein|nr:MAG: hypothetical protein BWY08_00944 [Bacteroidetes bacterium ADurb.Bin174]HPW66836.1 hypothetical protein [Salinivirgaceae bacterium]
MSSKQYKPFRITRILIAFGFNRHILFAALKNLPSFFRDYRKLKKQKQSNDDFYFGFCYPNLADKKSDSGTMRGHYFHQDLLVARRIYENKPVRHLDIGSRKTESPVDILNCFR